MFFSFRNRLFAISVLLLTIFVAGAGIYLHHTLGGWTEQRIQHDLTSRTTLVVNALSASLEEERPELVEYLGEGVAQRLTLIDADGRVLADTQLSEQEVADVDHHGERPEVMAALEEGFGLARRYSTSVETEMLYVAMPLDDGGQVVRVAVPLSDVDDALAHLRWLLIIGALFGLGAAVFMSSLASKLMSRSLQRVLDRSRRMQPQKKASQSASLHGVTRQLEETLDLLAQQRDRFRDVLDGMNDGVVATDEEGQIVSCNRAARGILQMDADNLGEPLSRWVDQEMIAAVMASPVAGMEFEAGETTRRRLHMRATRRDGGEGFVFVLQDVTALRQLERVRRDFVANVSHELRTPVTVIRANAETLIDGPLLRGDHARTFAEGIFRNAERLDRLIADLLDLSRIEAGEAEFDTQQVNLAALVGRAVEDLRRYVGETTTELVVEIDNDLVVDADGDGLEQVVLNLLENAFKYADGGAVLVRARPRGKMILVEILDDGPGIEEAHRERVFERFYRVDAGRATSAGGTGLGLSIVKHLVGAMGGEVGVRGRPSGGSIFWFTLPGAAP